MKKLWDDRRMFLSFIALVGLLYIMDKQQKDYSLEVVGLAGGIGMINAWERVKGAKPAEPKA